MSSSIQRNPHPDFKKVEASRPAFDSSSTFRYTKTPDPSWTFGAGPNTPVPETPHIQIDPYEPDRAAGLNYKLLISAIIPRPIALISSLAPDGSRNLAPFSYFNLVNHDPPLFTVGFSSPGTPETAKKDTIRNIVQSKECVINIIGEDYIEAANACSVDAPPGVSEWDISGLTPVEDCMTVKAPRVREAVVSIECKLDMVKEYASRADETRVTGTVAIFEGTRIWVREDAVNEERSLIDPAVSPVHHALDHLANEEKILKPISRLGGITYGRVTEAIELTRPTFKGDVGGEQGMDKITSSKS